MDSVITAFLLTTLAGLSTGIGSCIAFVAKHTNKKFLSVSLGFSDQVLRMCNKGILLEHGRLIAQGEVEDIVDLYDEKLGMERED